jgi:acetyl-CoA C-acetyltransferase
VVTSDEGVRADTTAELLAKLRPAVRRGRHDHGRLVLADLRRGRCRRGHEPGQAEELDLPWLAEIGAHGVVAGPDASLQSQPANAVKAALAKDSLGVGDLDLVEINEAFASVAIQSMRDLELDGEIVNVNGGAIALGHPIGMSGPRLALHLALELKRAGAAPAPRR